MENPPIQLPLSGTDELSREAPPSPEHPDPDNPPWGLGGAVMLLISFFLLLAAVQLAFLTPYAARRGVAPLTLTAVLEFAMKDSTALFITALSAVPAHILTLGVAWLLVTRVGKYPFLRTLGWERDRSFTLLRSAGLAVLLFVVGIVVIWYAGSPENELDRLIRSSRAAALAMAFAATFTAPLVEEIVFRGLLYSAIRKLGGTALAVGVVTVLFTLIHVPQYWPSYAVIGTIFLLSLALAVVRARTGKLLPCFIIHLTFNAIQAVLIVLNPYLERLLSEEKAAPAPGLLLELVLRFVGVAS